MPLIKKDNSVRLSENKRKRNSSFIEVSNNKNSEIDNEELNTSRDLNISLSNIEVTKTNFIHDFDRFLNKTKIKIINNFPVSLEEKNKFYFKQSNFGSLYLITYFIKAIAFLYLLLYQYWSNIIYGVLTKVWIISIQ